jgi:serine O-acetyltransferase
VISRVPAHRRRQLPIGQGNRSDYLHGLLLAPYWRASAPSSGAGGRSVHGAFLGKLVAVLRHRFWSVVTGADIPLNSRIAGRLELPHPNGIVIHPDSGIGPNCMIFQQATLAVGSDGAPRLGGNVLVGSGAKLLGGIRIGDNAQVGANAVVLHDVPLGATAVGVPARLILRQEARAKMLREY